MERMEHQREHFEDELLRLAQAGMTRGALPQHSGGELRATLGRDAACSLCGSPVSSQEIELTILPSLGGTRDLRFHCRCYIAWHRVCRVA
jgi:hypothetical protein